MFSFLMDPVVAGSGTLLHRGHGESAEGHRGSYKVLDGARLT